VQRSQPFAYLYQESVDAVGPGSKLRYYYLYCPCTSSQALEWNCAQYCAGVLRALMGSFDLALIHIGCVRTPPIRPFDGSSKFKQGLTYNPRKIAAPAIKKK
jgi:hypothetical protein